MLNQLFRTASHLIFRTGSFKHSNVKRFARNIHGRKILELGSGKFENGKYSFSDTVFFDKSNKIVMSDINPGFGHVVIDVTKMSFKGEFDVILCLNVLEHVYDYQTAVDNIHRALKKGGFALFLTPAFYPLHDEPHDYWRFTEHSLRRILKGFKITKLAHCGIRRYPSAYFIIAQKLA